MAITGLADGLADGLTRGAERLGASTHEALFEPVIRLGVTGLSRAGKTVFITALVANLLDRGRMPGLRAAADGRVQAAHLRPQPDDTVPRFDYEGHLAALTGAQPHWPQGTRAVSQLRLSFRVRPAGWRAALPGPRVVHLDIVDYPGEWLLDLGLLDQDYASWSARVLGRIGARGLTPGDAYLQQVRGTDAGAPFHEPTAQALATAFTTWLHAARRAGHADCTPGRFLLPGEMAGSPVLTFAPLPRPQSVPRGSLWSEMSRRFEAYKAQVVRPFFRDHFARIDRQIVLVDLLDALSRGPAALEDLRGAMDEILSAFRPGRNPVLSRLMRGRRVERLLFAATKADHLHHSQHDAMGAMMTALLGSTRTRAEFAGAEVQAMALAALRCTVEGGVTHEGAPLDCVRGWVAEGGARRQVAFHPGALPADPSAFLAAAHARAASWPGGAEFRDVAFLPAPSGTGMGPKPGPRPGPRPGTGAGTGPRPGTGGLPHIRLDRAAQYLLGDRL